jgi:hypothetical protein
LSFFRAGQRLESRLGYSFDLMGCYVVVRRQHIGFLSDDNHQRIEDSEGLGTGLLKTIIFWMHDVTSNVDNSLAIFVATPEINQLLITVEGMPISLGSRQEPDAAFRAESSGSSKIEHVLENEAAFDMSVIHDLT